MDQESGGNRVTLSETDKHWQQICLTLATIGTAVMAAVFLLSGLDEERPQPMNFLSVCKFTFGVLSIVVYGLMIVAAGRTILLDPRKLDAVGDRHKMMGFSTCSCYVPILHSLPIPLHSYFSPLRSALRRLWSARCLSRQTSQRVWPEIA